MRLSMAATMIAILAPSTVSAMGETVIRYPKFSRIGSCESTIVEQIRYGGNVYGSHAIYIAACIERPKFASWVLIFRAECGSLRDTNACQKSDQETIGKNVADLMDYASNSGKSVKIPAAMKGSSCEIISEKREYNWRCATYEKMTEILVSGKDSKFESFDPDKPIRGLGVSYDLPEDFQRGTLLKEKQSSGKQQPKQPTSDREQPGYVGRWTSNKTWCSNNADTTDEIPIVYEKDTIRGYDHTCSFKNVSLIGSEWTVSSRCVGEGEEWNYNFRMTVSGDTMIITDLDPKRRKTYNFNRCSR
jgi:hypothetical protein